MNWLTNIARSLFPGSQNESHDQSKHNTQQIVNEALLLEELAPTTVNIQLVENIVPLEKLDARIVQNIIEFLPQSDLIALHSTSTYFEQLTFSRLWKNVVVRKWDILEPRDLYKGQFFHVVTSDNWNDELDSLLKLSIKLGQTQFLEELIIEDWEYDVDSLDSLIRLFNMNLKSLKYVKIFDANLRKQFNQLVLQDSLQFENLNTMILDSVLDIEKIPDTVTTLLLNIADEDLIGYDIKKQFSNRFSETLSRITSLTISDDQDSSLRVLKFFKDVLGTGKEKMHLKQMKFNHFHGKNNYNTISREFSVLLLEDLIELEFLEDLQLVVNCIEPDCDCLSTFLNTLAGSLVSLKSVAISQKVFHTKAHVELHQSYEDYDLIVFAFLNNLPRMDQIERLYISNDSPLDGKIEDGLEGNFNRRRRLYEATLPKFTSLKQLVLPDLMSSICCYEQEVSDLLWNGCECDFCLKCLPLFDNYLMTHQYFDFAAFDYKDVISPRLFGFFADACAKRQPFFDSSKVSESFEENVVNKNTASVLKRFETFDKIDQIAPNFASWNFHGYSKIICRDFKHDDDEDFYTEEFIKYVDKDKAKQCYYDESCFDLLVVCVSHFFRNKFLLWLDANVPSVESAIFNGIYFDKRDHFFHMR